MKDSREIRNTEGFIDSRDIINRIEWLEDMEEELDEYEKEELTILRDVEEQGESSPDWNYGATLIRDSYFEEYAQQLAEDIGAIGRDLQWPLYHIDWEAAADSLRVDYSTIDFDGVEYLVRG